MPGSIAILGIVLALAVAGFSWATLRRGSRFLEDWDERERPKWESEWRASQPAGSSAVALEPVERLEQRYRLRMAPSWNAALALAFFPFIVGLAAAVIERQSNGASGPVSPWPILAGVIGSLVAGANAWLQRAKILDSLEGKFGHLRTWLAKELDIHRKLTDSQQSEIATLKNEVDRLKRLIDFNPPPPPNIEAVPLPPEY